MELQTLVERLKRTYATSPNPGKDIDNSGIMDTARAYWDNADDIRMAIERKMFESHAKPILFNDYFFYAIFAVQCGDDNGFRQGTYIEHKYRPYVERYLDNLESHVLPGWNIRAMPLADIILKGDIMAHQAVWEYNNATSYSIMRPGDWAVETTFIYEMSDKDEFSIKNARGFGQLIERHYTIDGCWPRLIKKDRVQPELHCLFESMSESAQTDGPKAKPRTIVPLDF